MLKYIKKGLKIDRILVPTNGSFCYSKDLIHIVENYIAKFFEAGTFLNLSLSFDGPLLDKTARPILNKVDKNEEFIENVFNFCERNNCGFHPMISPINIEQQIENYKLWI